MEVYKGRKTGILSLATILPLAGGLLLIPVGALALLNPNNEPFPYNLILGILGVLFIYCGSVLMMSLFRGGITYTLAESELIIKLPTFHKKSFRYSDMESAEKVDNVAAGKILEEAQWEIEKIRVNMDLIGQAQLWNKYVTIYCTPGSATVFMQHPGYSPILGPEPLPTKIMATAHGVFVLIKVRKEGNEYEKYLLTPQDVDSFVIALKAKLGNRLPGTGN